MDANIKDIVELIAAIVGVASIFIKLFPNLPISSKILPIIKFIGKWIALNKPSVADADRPK